MNRSKPVRRPARLFLAAVGAALLSAAPGAAETQEVQQGRRFVQDNCAACHAIGPEGDSPVAAAPPLRELGRRYPIDGLAEAFAEGIVTGHPDMPEFALDPDTLSALLAYLKSLAG